MATLRAPFHLRPRAVGASIGPVLPGGTTVEVLALSNLQRAPGQQVTRPPVLAHVRLATGRQEGYTFVGPRELDAGCPLLAGAEPTLGSIYTRLGHAWRVNYRMGSEGNIPQRRLTGWTTPFDPAHDTLLERVDLDHNGTQETLFVNSEDGIRTIVLWRGTPGLVLTQEWSHDHHTSDYDGSLRAGRAVYFVVRNWSMGMCGYNCSVVATGHTSGRVQRLRWDPARFVLVAEGVQMAVLAEPHEGYCPGERLSP